MYPSDIDIDMTCEQKCSSLGYVKGMCFDAECPIDHIHVDSEDCDTCCCKQPYGREDCNGCMEGNNCLPFGTRAQTTGTPKFCDIDGSFKDQKPEGMECQNSYECNSNFCTAGECVDISRELRETRNILQTIVNFIRTLFSLNNK